MKTVDIAGVEVPVTSGEPGWLPASKLVLTPTTAANLQKILHPLKQGYNLLLVGDAGVGKNALIYYINHLRNHSTVRYSFNEDTLPEDLVGSYRIDPVNHSFVWSDGSLARALRTGATFVADEMNLAPPEVLKRFYSVFTDRFLQILEGDASIIQAGEGFNFVATQNPAEGFEGRKNLPREIQKYFATIFVDPYPFDELVAILKGLNPEIPEAILTSLVTINARVEEMVVQKKIGGRDLERYHFNLRNLNRLSRRIAGGTEHLLREINDIYIEPFRAPEDRQKIQETAAAVIKEILDLDANFTESRQVQIQVASNSITIGRASPGVGSSGFSEIAKTALHDFPPVESRLLTLESLSTALANGENVLLECDSDVEPEDYVEFFAALSGRNLTTITLSRGMHTADIIGGLKPAPNANLDGGAAVRWVDGPLTEAVRKGDYILLKGLEAAGPELVEKLNMLTDDTRALMLPPEAGETEPLLLNESARIFAIKFFRHQRSTPSISRAFRNRFSAFVIFPTIHSESLKEIAASWLETEDLPELTKAMVSFHLLIRERSLKREIGSANLQPYFFGLTNLKRWCEHTVESIKNGKEELKSIIYRGAAISYINEISDPSERRKMHQSLEHLLGGVPLEEMQEKLSEALKKKAINQRSYFDKINWDPEKHKREPVTGKAKWNLNGKPIQKGIEIDTPETGGKTKEGQDAWYGEETKGNLGVGEPGQGGGGWGTRTEELYKEFLKKRRALWEYNIGATLEDFNEVFGAEIQRVMIDFDKLLDPQVDIHRRYMSSGSRVDARRYLTYLTGRGDDRVFDKTTVAIEEDRLKGVEVVLAVNKGRRIFNFEYSIATLVALMSLAAILNNHNIPFGVCGYSDLTNEKRTIDLSWFKRIEEEYRSREEEELFYGLARNWHGDTVAEYQMIEELSGSFSPSAKTRIIVMVSDFRGARGKISIEKDMGSTDTVLLKQSVDKLTPRGLILLGVGVGARAISDAVFHESMQVGGENFANLPSLLSAKITELIHRHHNAAVL